MVSLRVINEDLVSMLEKDSYFILGDLFLYILNSLEGELAQYVIDEVAELLRVVLAH